MIRTRFAPSPNGSLHLGHAFAAVTAHDLAQRAGGRFLLRVEDIDGPRSRPELAQEFRDDLAWLGLAWDEVPAQSTRLQSYALAAERLKAAGLLYPCQCSRAEIAAGGCHHAVGALLLGDRQHRVEGAPRLEGAGNLQAAVRNGCTDFNKLCKTTGAGMGCGSCKPEVKAVLQATLKSKTGSAALQLANAKE